VLPPFQENGFLPPGIHAVPWEEIVARFGFSLRRRILLAGLRGALEALQTAGCQQVYINGSFVTNKPEPNDFDACWNIAGVEVELLDPVLLDFSEERAAQKAKYLGELSPAQLPEGASGLRFLDFFQIDKATGAAKGILVLDLDTFEPMDTEGFSPIL
jgi:hypothetical protein